MCKKHINIIILLCVVTSIILFTFQLLKDSSYNFYLDSDQIEQIKLFYHGDTVLVSDNMYVTSIVDNFNGLTLQPVKHLSTGFVYRISFLDGNNQVVYETDILSENHLAGRQVINGVIDMDLLKAAFKAGVPIS